MGRLLRKAPRPTFYSEGSERSEDTLLDGGVNGQEHCAGTTSPLPPPAPSWAGEQFNRVVVQENEEGMSYTVKLRLTGLKMPCIFSIQKLCDGSECFDGRGSQNLKLKHRK